MDSDSMRTFILKELADNMKFDVVRTEQLSVYTFGSKISIQKTFKLTLENIQSENSKLNIETMVTDSISSSDIPPLELEI